VTQLADHTKEFYRFTRLKSAKDEWPLGQHKGFTPLVLLYSNDVKDICKPCGSGGNIDVTTAKSTKDFSVILATLEHCSDEPQFILVEGAPGIGKTVFLKYIALSWAEERKLQKYELVFLVHLRDPEVLNIATLEEFLQFFCKNTMGESDISLCIKYFFSNQGKTITFLFDGYDELPKRLRDVNSTGLIADILNRKVLPKCGLIVSSRPHASLYLRKDATLQVDIRGFTEEERKQYIEQSLDEASEREKLITYLEKNISISSLCYIPYNLVLLVFLYLQGALPTNATDLYSLFIRLTIGRNLQKRGVKSKQKISTIFLNLMATLSDSYQNYPYMR